MSSPLASLKQQLPAVSSPGGGSANAERRRSAAAVNSRNEELMRSLLATYRYVCDHSSWAHAEGKAFAMNFDPLLSKSEDVFEQGMRALNNAQHNQIVPQIISHLNSDCEGFVAGCEKSALMFKDVLDLENFHSVRRSEAVDVQKAKEHNTKGQNVGGEKSSASGGKTKLKLLPAMEALKLSSDNAKPEEEEEVDAELVQAKAEQKALIDKEFEEEVRHLKKQFPEVFT
eukprot:Nk52_evm2s401 gene=Nk52_evmTU2s401